MHFRLVFTGKKCEFPFGSGFSWFFTFGNHDKEKCFLVCPPLQETCMAIGNNVSWFVHLQETGLGNNVSWFSHLRETGLRNNASWFVYLQETWLGNNFSSFAQFQETWLENYVSRIAYLPETWLENNVSWFPTFRKHGYRKQCFLVCQPSGNMAIRNNVSWFAHLQVTRL